jgi:ABC-type cobalt transport system substrate-binding protein
LFDLNARIQQLMINFLWKIFHKPIILVVLTTANFGGGSVISAGTIHDLGRVKVPGTGPLWNPCSNKYLKFDLIKHCHVIFIHSLGQLLIIRSYCKVHRSRGNPKEIPTWASHVSNYSYFPWFNRQQTWRPATGSSL